MSFTVDLLQGLAGVLDAAAVAKYRSDGSTYLASESAVTFSFLPQTPDRCVALTAYNTIDATVQAFSQVSVQFRFRGNTGDPLDVDNFADGAFQVLQALSGVLMGSAYLVQILRRSVVPLGPDDSQRWERSDNYLADVNVPQTAHRYS